MQGTVTAQIIIAHFMHVTAQVINAHFMRVSWLQATIV